MKKTALFILGCLILPCLSQAEMKLPALLGDHMVLQQGKASLWGKAEAGKTLTLTLAGQTTTAKVGMDGKWKTSFPMVKTGGPYELVISGDGTITIKDVMVGEVWVASGQSNMELPLNNTKDSQEEIAKADDSQTRWFVQDRGMGEKPSEEPHGIWKVCSPETAKDFSGSAYYFAKNLRKKLKVPVGILGTYWGGTWIESWIPRDTFETDLTIRSTIKEWDSLSPEQKQERGGLQTADIRFWGLKLVPKNPKAKALSILVKPSDKPGKEKALGGSWSSNAQINSAISFTAENNGGPKPGPVGRLKAEILAGGWGNSNTSFADGKSVDLSAYEGVEFYAKGTGKFNVIFFQPIVTDWDNYGSQPLTATGAWKKFHVSFKDLKQSGWGMPKPFAPSALQAVCLNPMVPPMTAIPAGLYNGMVHGLTQYGIKGVIWYQGETNAEKNAVNYRNLLPALIRGWRKIWGQGDFPFIYAQLPNFMAVQSNPSDSAWAEIREGERLTLSVPNTGMAVLLDVGEANDIHPKNKKDVGERLALAALHTAYNQPGLYSGPLFDSASVKGGKFQVRFTATENALMTKDGGPVTGFAVAGLDGIYHWAKAKITDSKTVEVWSEDVKEPIGIRYAWADNPLFNLYNKSLPASPFEFKLKAFEKPKSVIDKKAADEIPSPP